MGDVQAALLALNALGDSSTLPDEQRNALEMEIRAALTAQDVNAELLKALKLWMSDEFKTDDELIYRIRRTKQAIARAEKKGGV